MPGSPPPDDIPRGRRSAASSIATTSAPAHPEPPRAPRRSRAAAASTTPSRPEPAADPDAIDVPVIPVRRLLSLTIAGFSALLAVGLIMGAQTSGVAARLPFAIVVFGAQALYVFATTMAMRPPAAKVVAAVGVLSALGANYAVNVTAQPSIGPLAFIAAGGLVLGMVGQMVLREGRARVTESLGTTLVIVVGVVAFATLLVLVRVPLGTQTIMICLTSCGIALGIARLTDVVAPIPRLAAQVPRGATGIVLGAMAGTGVAAYIGAYLVGFTPSNAAMVGAGAAIAAVLADLTIGFAEVGRELEGDPPTMWLARHMQGPLAGFALAAPVAYLATNIIWHY